MGEIFINIIIDRKNGIPFYIQIKQQIIGEIKRGTLRVGTKLPTERELSEMLKVSRNTVSTAYNDLEHGGDLKAYQGKGTFVAKEATSWKSQRFKNKIIKFVDLGIDEVLKIGMQPEEFFNIVNQRVHEKNIH